MNLLLLDEHEIDAGQVTLRDRRATHLREVLDVTIGQSLCAGLVDGPFGVATVVSRSAEEIELSCTFEDNIPPLRRDVLLLAVPRPNILARCLEQATALGFGTILLHRTWRVDKSHLRSRILDPNSLDHHLRLGLEQSRRTHRPKTILFERFKPFVKDELEELIAGTQRFVAHPDDTRDTADLSLTKAPFSLAIGPEGGYIPFEVELLEAHGFTAIRPSPHPLKVETALAVCQGQLDVLRAMPD